jgi:hypothetical protein
VKKGDPIKFISIDQYLVIISKIEDDQINDFIASSSSLENTHILEHVMKQKTRVTSYSTRISPIKHESPLEKDQGSLIKPYKVS